MASPEEENGVGDIVFSWGRKAGIGGKNLNRQDYESFTYDGLEYFLYDSVYLWMEGQSEPYIGKIVNIFETEKRERFVKVVWYLRPSEIRQWFKGTSLGNELFLASGEGKGLYNYNPLAAIAGKCNVVCTSKDERNPRASVEELKMADYTFSRTFDVGCCKLSERFPDKIAGLEVGHFFNQRKDFEHVTHSKPKLSKGTVLKIPAAIVGKQTCSSASVSTSYPLKKRKIHDTVFENGKGIGTSNQEIELKRRLEVVNHGIQDSSKWFKEQPWEDRMRKAQEMGSLILLENLDPSITSAEVEDIVWDAFKIKASAKMIQRTDFSIPYSGQALVIFKSKDEADFAISELRCKCLMLRKLRPVVGSRPLLKNPGNPSKFFGHHSGKVKQKQRAEMKNAVSTSHYSQPNTIEFEMAMEWLTLRAKSNMRWDALYKQQEKEMEKVVGELKSRLKVPPSKVKFQGGSKE